MSYAALRMKNQRYCLFSFISFCLQVIYFVFLKEAATCHVPEMSSYWNPAIFETCAKGLSLLGGGVERIWVQLLY